MNLLSNAKKAIPGVVGGLAANFGSNKLSSFIGNEKLRAGGLFALGLILMSSSKTAAIGTGVAITAGVKLVGSFVPALAGFDDMPFDANDVVNGVVNGTGVGGHDYYDSNSEQF